METAAPSSSGRATAPFRREDVREVAALFFRAFRDGRVPPDDFAEYLAASFFGSPNYSEEQGGLVHRNAVGAIDSALLVLPIQVSVSGRTITGRLMSNYMTDPAAKPTRGGAELALTIRARNQEFCFSDSANPVSLDHWKAVGGHVLPIHGLDFQRIFRPVEWLAHRSRRRAPAWIAALAMALARPLDIALRRAVARLRVAEMGPGATMTQADFIAVAPGLVERFAVHPVWGGAELTWLLGMAAQNTANGPMHLREYRDAKGHLAGCAVYYAQRGDVARVLNILTRPGRESIVVTTLLAELDALGCVAVEGIAQPFLMEALSRQSAMRYVPRGACCITTRHPEIVDAALRGDIYLGGLMGEDWSRLVTDFHD